MKLTCQKAYRFFQKVYVKPELEDEAKSKFNNKNKDSKSPNESNETSPNAISKYREQSSKKNTFSLQPTDKSNKKAAGRRLMMIVDYYFIEYYYKNFILNVFCCCLRSTPL